MLHLSLLVKVTSFMELLSSGTSCDQRYMLLYLLCDPQKHQDEEKQFCDKDGVAFISKPQEHEFTLCLKIICQI